MSFLLRVNSLARDEKLVFNATMIFLTSQTFKSTGKIGNVKEKCKLIVIRYEVINFSQRGFLSLSRFKKLVNSINNLLKF